MKYVDLVRFFIEGCLLSLWLSLPAIIVGSVIGTLFALFQALTQIQEQTLSFGVKLVSMAFVLVLTASWMGAEMYNYTVRTFDMISRLAY